MYFDYLPYEISEKIFEDLTLEEIAAIDTPLVREKKFIEKIAKREKITQKGNLKELAAYKTSKKARIKGMIKYHENELLDTVSIGTEDYEIIPSDKEFHSWKIERALVERLSADREEYVRVAITYDNLAALKRFAKHKKKWIPKIVEKESMSIIDSIKDKDNVVRIAAVKDKVEIVKNTRQNTAI